MKIRSHTFKLSILGLRKEAGSRSCRERNAACSCHRWGEVISCKRIPVPPADIFFFSRMAAKVRQQPVTDQDVLEVEEQQVNFCLARDSVQSSLQICHPIVVDTCVDQYDICALVKSKAVKKLKVALLQALCESLELQVLSTQVRRKAPYVALL